MSAYQVTLEGNLSFVGTEFPPYHKVFEAFLNASGNLERRSNFFHKGLLTLAAHVASTRSWLMIAALSFRGSPVRAQYGRILRAGLSFHGAIGRQFIVPLYALLKPASNFSKHIYKSSYKATLAFAGKHKSLITTIFDAILSFGSLSAINIRRLYRATLSTIGKVTKFHAVTHRGLLKMAGQTNTTFQMSFTASLNSFGRVRKTGMLVLQAVLSFSGHRVVIVNFIQRAFLTVRGHAYRTTSAVLHAIWSGTGRFTKTVKALSFRAALSMSGVMNAYYRYALRLAASLGMTGQLTKMTQRTWAALLTTTGGFFQKLTGDILIGQWNNFLLLFDRRPSYQVVNASSVNPMPQLGVGVLATNPPLGELQSGIPFEFTVNQNSGNTADPANAESPDGRFVCVQFEIAIPGQIAINLTGTSGNGAPLTFSIYSGAPGLANPTPLVANQVAGNYQPFSYNFPAGAYYMVFNGWLSVLYGEPVLPLNGVITVSNNTAVMIPSTPSAGDLTICYL